MLFKLLSSVMLLFAIEGAIKMDYRSTCLVLMASLKSRVSRMISFSIEKIELIKKINICESRTASAIEKRLFLVGG